MRGGLEDRVGASGVTGGADAGLVDVVEVGRAGHVLDHGDDAVAFEGG